MSATMIRPILSWLSRGLLLASVVLAGKTSIARAEEPAPPAEPPPAPKAPPMSLPPPPPPGEIANIIWKRVKLSSPMIGSMRLKVRDIAISESLVMLMYGLDDDIIEPPPHGAENPISVEYEKTTYRCMCSDWTAELQGYLFVVLVRLPDAKE